MLLYIKDLRKKANGWYPFYLGRTRLISNIGHNYLGLAPVAALLAASTVWPANPFPGAYLSASRAAFFRIEAVACGICTVVSSSILRAAGTLRTDVSKSPP